MLCCASGSPPLVAWIGYRSPYPGPQGWEEAVQLYFTDFRKALAEVGAKQQQHMHTNTQTQRASQMHRPGILVQSKRKP